MKERILLIEDNAAYRSAVAALLSEHCQVDEAETLAQGVQMAVGNDYWAILLDLGLPDSNWADTFHTFSQVTPAAPVIIVSQHEDPDLVAAHIRQGAAGYVVKGRDDRDAEGLYRALHRAVLHAQSERGLQEAARVAHDTARITKQQINGGGQV